MRQLATIRKIDSILPIEGADAIECAVVGGWKVVVKKGEFQPNDLAVYVEIDSWVPHALAPFLSKGHEPREFNGVKGERLRTAKLRGQISQGLLLPVFKSGLKVPEEAKREVVVIQDKDGVSLPFVEGSDVSEVLGIQKWEAPIPAQLAGDVEGLFPSFIPKTDQERIQNLVSEYDVWKQEGDEWEVTEKLDGSSMTVFMKDGHFGVCSRNWELRESEGNSLWRVARQYDIEEILRTKGHFALQGELIGEGIQGNPYKIKGQDFFVFDVYDIDQGRYLSPSERKEFLQGTALKHVPILNEAESFKNHVGTIHNVLAWAEGKSVLNDKTEREGLVFKRCDGFVSFKAISNVFLLKSGG